jgi:cytoskeletal protein RodZ
MLQEYGPETRSSAVPNGEYGRMKPTTNGKSVRFTQQTTLQITDATHLPVLYATLTITALIH